MGKGLTITAFVFSFLIPIVGLILGIIAYNKAKEDPEALKDLAIAAIVIGAILTVIPLLILLIVGVAWMQVKGTIEDGSSQIELSTQCMLVDLRINSIDTSSDTISISRGVAGEGINKIKVYINSQEKAEIDATPLETVGSQEIPIEINPGDLVEISAVIGEFPCTQRYSLEAE